MRLFALPAALLAIAGCGDLQPESDEDIGAVEAEVDEEEGNPPEEENPPAAAREITGDLMVAFPSCDANVAEFEVGARYADDNSAVANVGCRVLFDDGAVSNDCSGQHTFVDGGSHDFVVEVTDLDSGAVARVEQTRILPAILSSDLQLDVPACGLEFSYAANLSTGAELSVYMAEVDAFVDAHHNTTIGTFTALNPGTYTLRLTAEDERPLGPICQIELERTVTLAACPHNHPPDPHCPH